MVFNAKYIGLTFTLVGVALELYWGFSLYAGLAVGLCVIGLALYAQGQSYHPAWGVLALVPIVGPIAGLVELTEKSRAGTVSPRIKYWGLGLILMGTLLSFLLLFLMRLNDFVPALPSRDLLPSSALISTLILIIVPGFGLALYAEARGRAPEIVAFAFMPVIGPIIGLLVLAMPVWSKLGVIPPRHRQPRVSALLILTMLGCIWGIGLNAELPYRARERQAEARNNLRAIHEAQMAFYEKHRRFGTFNEIGFVFQGHYKKYTYRLGQSNTQGLIFPVGSSASTPDNTIVPAGLSPDGQHFTATATGNLDWDSTIDQWHVNDLKQGLDKADVDDATD